MKLLNTLVIVGLSVFLIVGCGKKETEVEVVQEQANVNIGAQMIFEQAEKQMSTGNGVEAKQLYQKLMVEHPDYENIEQVQKKISKINLDLIVTSSQYEPYTTIHEVVPGDTLGKLAKKYNTTIDLIKMRNKLKNDIIRVGQRLSIWQAPFSIFIDKSQNILMLKMNDEVLKVYNVATGENNSTPIGDYSITTKLVDPVWFKSGAVVAPDSPANVLGTRWMGFDLPGYGIHGTTEPDTIGQQASAGCVRMLNQEVEELFSIVPISTKVQVVD